MLFLSSCVKSEVDRYPFVVGNFHSECKIGNVEYYGNYNVAENNVEIYLIRREKCILYIKDYDFGDYVYTMNKDTVYIDKEIYHYNLEEFKDLLIKKNTLQRDTTVFKITNNMYCTWKCFDEMYNTYIHN